MRNLLNYRKVTLLEKGGRLAVLAILLATFFFVSTSAKGEDEVERVMDAWEQTREKCRAIKIKWTESSTYRKGSLDVDLPPGSAALNLPYPPEDTTISCECLFMLHEDNMRRVTKGDGWSSTKAKFMPSQRTSIFNGDVEKSLLSGEEFEGISWGFIRSTKFSLDERDITLRPILGTYRAPSENLMELLELSGDSWAIKQGSVDDTKCLIIESTQSRSVRSYWLDPQLNYVVRRYDVRTTSGVPILSVTTKFRSDDQLRPIPLSWVITLYTALPPGGNVDQTASNAIVDQTITGTVTETEFDFDYSAADFDIEFPASTVVQDERDRRNVTMYVITKKGERRDVPKGASWKKVISGTPKE